MQHRRIALQALAACALIAGTGAGLGTAQAQTKLKWAHVYETSEPFHKYSVWAAEEIKNKAQASGRFIVVQNSMSFDAPQVTVTIDRDRAAALNLPIADIGRTLTLLVGGAEVAQFDRDSNSYDVIPQVPQEFRDNPEKLGEYFVRSVTGEMVPLSAVVHIATNAAPAAIEQFNQLNSATISALPVPGVTPLT